MPSSGGRDCEGDRIVGGPTTSDLPKAMSLLTLLSQATELLLRLRMLLSSRILGQIQDGYSSWSVDSQEALRVLQELRHLLLTAQSISQWTANDDDLGVVDSSPQDAMQMALSDIDWGDPYNGSEEDKEI